jgi:hypothetical protein
MSARSVAVMIALEPASPTCRGTVEWYRTEKLRSCNVTPAARQ